MTSENQQMETRKNEKPMTVTKELLHEDGVHVTALILPNGRFFVSTCVRFQEGKLHEFTTLGESRNAFFGVNSGDETQTSESF